MYASGTCCLYLLQLKPVKCCDAGGCCLTLHTICVSTAKTCTSNTSTGFGLMPAGVLSNMRKHPSGWMTKRKSTDMRVAAVVCMILALASGGCAATNFVDMYPDYAAQVKEDHGRFCKRHLR
jgi:hypothetical protein